MIKDTYFAQVIMSQLTEARNITRADNKRLEDQLEGYPRTKLLFDLFYELVDSDTVISRPSALARIYNSNKLINPQDISYELLGLSKDPIIKPTIKLRLARINIPDLTEHIFAIAHLDLSLQCPWIGGSHILYDRLKYLSADKGKWQSEFHYGQGYTFRTGLERHEQRFPDASRLITEQTVKNELWLGQVQASFAQSMIRFYQQYPGSDVI